MIWDELEKWYQHRNIDCGYRLGELTLPMLGDSSRPVMSGKAAETGVLLDFAAELSRKHRAVVTHGKTLAKAGPPLVRYLELMKETPQQVDERTRDIFLECFKMHCIHLEDAAVPFSPNII